MAFYVRLIDQGSHRLLTGFKRRYALFFEDMTENLFINRLHPVQLKLMEETLATLPEAGMMGAVEVVQLNQLMMRILKAKKAIDVGVFTGMSSLSAALVLPDDGKVLACDTSESYTSIGN